MFIFLVFVVFILFCCLLFSLLRPPLLRASPQAWASSAGGERGADESLCSQKDPSLLAAVEPLRQVQGPAAQEVS